MFPSRLTKHPPASLGPSGPSRFFLPAPSCVSTLVIRTRLTELELFPSPGSQTDFSSWLPVTDPLAFRTQCTLQRLMGNNGHMARSELDSEGLHRSHGVAAGFMRPLLYFLWWGAHCGCSSLTQLMVVETPINNPPDHVFYCTALQLKAPREYINQDKWKTGSGALKVGGELWLVWDGRKTFMIYSWLVTSCVLCSVQSFTAAVIIYETAAKHSEKEGQNLMSVQPEVWNTYGIKTCPSYDSFLFYICNQS